MGRAHWITRLLLGTWVLLPAAVACAYAFVQSLGRALAFGTLLYVALATALVAAAYRVRNATMREQIERHGEVVAVREVLTLHIKSRPPATVHIADMLELWYQFNPFGWQHANNWRLVYQTGQRRQDLDVWDYAHLVEPLLSWCKALPNFDESAFQRLMGLPCGAEDDILVWRAGV